MGKVCDICGNPSGFMPYCKTCANKGVVKCEKCGKWHLENEKCICEKIEQKEVEQNFKVTCLICGKNSNGLHFCKECYSKYKDRSVDIRIINCIITEILDDYGNKKLCCDDGRKVRSKSELIISNFLFNNKIRAVYEKEIYYTENGENKTLHPDFYLPDYDLYIEHNGYSGKAYEKQKAYSQKIYGQLNYKIIITSEEDINNINACLKPKLGLH